MTLFQLHKLYSIKWDGKMVVNSENIWILKEAIMAYLKVLAYDNWLPGRDLNWKIPKYIS